MENKLFIEDYLKGKGRKFKHSSTVIIQTNKRIDLKDNQLFFGKVDSVDGVWFSNKMELVQGYISLRMTWFNISSASAIIAGDENNVDDWNTFFDLPVNGVPFTSVKVYGDRVDLYGGNGINIIDDLFDDVNSFGSDLKRIEDFVGCVISAGNNCFGDNNNNGCQFLEKVYFPAMVTAGNNTFVDCTNLAEAYFPVLQHIGDSTFTNCSVLNDFSEYYHNLYSLNQGTMGQYFYTIFPELVDAGNNAFMSCQAFDHIAFPKLIKIGNYCFAYCSKLFSPVLFYLEECGDFSFYNCKSLSDFSFQALKKCGSSAFRGCDGTLGPVQPVLQMSFDLWALVNMGISVGLDNVFLGIIGQNINIKIPIGLETCNAGNPDDDLLFLRANNIVLTSYS